MERPVHPLTLPPAMRPPRLTAAFASVLVAGTPLLAQSQSVCSSDGQAQPVALVERFINADCGDCWSQAPALVPGPSAQVLDWIVPGTRLGDDAPLAAAALRESLERLQQLHRPVPATTDVHVSEVGAGAASPGRLRVMAGPPVNDYRAAAISLPRGKAVTQPTYRYTLLLVESLPAGTEGSAAPRNLVRNVLQDSWTQANELPHGERGLRWLERRPMRMPDGTDPERMNVVGWLEDADGRVVAAARSRCTPSPR